MEIYTLDGDLYMTINTKKRVYDYDSFARLCRIHIVTDKYYKILNDYEPIYTTLYIDRFEGEITINRLTIIFLSYDVNEVENVVQNSCITVPDKYKSDREIAIKIMLWCCYSVKNLDQKFRNDREIALLILKNQKAGHILSVLSKELCDDEEIVSMCIKYVPYNLNFASERLRNKLSIDSLQQKE